MSYRVRILPLLHCRLIQDDGQVSSLSLLEGIQEGTLLGFYVKPDSQGEIQSLSPSHPSSSPLHSTSSLDSSIYLSSSHSGDSLSSERNLLPFLGNSLHIDRESLTVPGKGCPIDLILVCIRDNWVIQLTFRLWECTESACLLSSSAWSVTASKQGLSLCYNNTSLLLAQPVAEGQWATISVSCQGSPFGSLSDNQSPATTDWNLVTTESITVNATRTVMDILSFEIHQNEKLSLQLLIPYFSSISPT